MGETGRLPQQLPQQLLQQQQQQQEQHHQPHEVSQGHKSPEDIPPGFGLAQPSIAAHELVLNGSEEQQHPGPCGLHQTQSKQMHRHPPLGQSWGGYQSAPVLPCDADVADTYCSPQPGSGDSAAGDARSQPGFDVAQLHAPDCRPSAPSRCESVKTNDLTSEICSAFVDAHGGHFFAADAANITEYPRSWIAPQDMPLDIVRPGRGPVATGSRSFVNALPVADCALARYSALAATEATDDASASTAPWRNGVVGAACTESQTPQPQRSLCVPGVPLCVQTTVAKSGDAWPHLLDDLERALEESESDGELPPWPHEM